MFQITFALFIYLGRRSQLAAGILRPHAILLFWESVDFPQAAASVLGHPDQGVVRRVHI